ncbi:acetate uptake transporter [Pedobacter sandarakinus]|uniref:acetate uptake transporter n=1 Tax=Pedobacter sandarakinus TaxID=353156 RepID=UPI0022486F86|nr:acetate uptake transporter [Pedobacter sandarakinus]MCX2574132.1 acetate uptake transporter [Pedobacter sandarakinus]
MSENLNTTLTSNPGPLGLCGFGMTTVLLNLHNSGLFKLDAMILAMGIFVGGIAQLIAGVLESKKNNTFGLTAFVLYGSFWLTLVALILMQKFSAIEAVSTPSMTAFLFVWALITSMFLVGSTRISKALMVVFILLTLLFLLLAFSELFGSSSLKVFAGFEGIVCGLSALYLAAATIINEVFDETLLPIGTYTNKSKTPLTLID